MDKPFLTNRAGGAGLVSQVMAGPIYETFQDFSSSQMLVRARNMRVCHLQAMCTNAIPT